MKPYGDAMPEIPQAIPHDSGFVEVADRCWLARWEFLDVNVGVVGGDRGLLVVDTHASEVAARRVVDQVRRLGVGEVVAVVNTHKHFDHVFGNVVFLEEYGDGGTDRGTDGGTDTGTLPIYAHDSVPADLAAHAPALQAEARDDDSRPDHADVAATRVVPPNETFSSARAVDLGDRLVELVHPGRGHTAGDVVVRVSDADVVFAGDLVEESALRSGLLLAPQGLGAMLVMPLAGRLTDRVGVGRVVIPGLVLVMASAFGLTGLSGDTSYWRIGALLFVLGLGIGLSMMPIFSGAMQTLRRASIDEL